MKKGVIIAVMLIFLILPVSAGILRVTEEHPFLVDDSWVSAKNLEVGDILQTSDGKQVAIKRITWHNQLANVFNLESSLFHNFILGDNLIAHNSNKPKPVYEKIAIVKSGMTNNLIVESRVIVDASINPKKVLNALKQEGVEPAEVKGIFVSHSHFDHVSQLSELKKNFCNARIIVAEEAVPWLRQGETQTLGDNYLPGLKGNILRILSKILGAKSPAVILGEGDIVIPKGASVVDASEATGISGAKIVRTPGHSEDSISLIMPDGSAFVGDAVVSNWALGRDYMPFVFKDMGQVVDSWKLLLKEGADKIYPAHGRMITGKQLEGAIAKWERILGR